MTVDRSKIGRRSRTKGASYERELVHVFRSVMPGADIKRGLQSRSGSDVADVECPIFWIEAKRGKKPNPRAALAQAIDASQGTHKIPLAIIRDDHCDAFCVLTLDDMLEFIETFWELSNA